jgi:flavin-dependent dehydrogenase
MDKIIKIGGAGISGLTAAINLAKAGYKVQVFDAAKDSGVRFHDDFQGIENWSMEQDALELLKEINIDVNFPYNECNKLSLIVSQDYQREYKGYRPIYYMVKRGTSPDSLDQNMKRQALSLGVEIFYSHPVKPEEVDIVASGPILNDYSDGVVSGYIFKTDLEDSHTVIFNDDYAPDGYSYFLVNRGHATLAALAIKDFKNAKKYRERTLELLKKCRNFKMEEVREFGGTGNFFLPKIPKDKKIYVGEAGGFQEWLFGFGMKNAMRSGYFAAKSIIEGKDFYKICRKEFFPSMRGSVVNRLAFALLGNKIYKWILNHYNGDPIKFGREMYKYPAYKKIFFPIASLILRKNIRDPRKFSKID